MTESIADRLNHVRADLNELKLDAFILPRADEYLGEYVPAHNERLKWISGFTGSAGMVVILKDRAAIFVDGRYTLQVRSQVPAAQFEFLHLISNPHAQWLTEALPAGARIGYDPRLHSLKWRNDTEIQLRKGGMELIEIDSNPVDRHWLHRPGKPRSMISILDDQFTGKSSSSKRADVAQIIRSRAASAALISSLDAIAWLLNIRGDDVPCLPVMLGFAILHADTTMHVFCDTGKIPDGIDAHIGGGVTFLAEDKLADGLASLGNSGANVLADPETTNAWCQLHIEREGGAIIHGEDPTLLLKSVKNPVELEGMRRCHIRDGIAEVSFLQWFDHEVSEGRLHDEATLSNTLGAYRQQQENNRGLSFDTISAAGANGAIVHYNHLNGDPGRVEMGNLYLVDSGGQYLDGTTDITRTIAVGGPSDEHRRMFTLVLKGHIALASARFPSGTTGSQLDILARQFLWQHGFDYDHGTGHGVGCFLSVHEGPQRVSKHPNTTALQPGMVLSDEPGYYKQGEYGIRCENLLAVRECTQPRGGVDLLEFEVLTQVPFDLKLVDQSLMSREEILWLNNYHASVREKLSPMLSGAALDWLNQATRVLGSY